jgi:hypothetical protein
MSIGGGIALIVIGAILTFALNVTVGWINLQLVGDILMVAGVIIVIIGIILTVRKRRSVVTTRQSVDPQAGQRYDTVDRQDDVEP